ncbi:MAG: NAD(P)-dependent oxidoreductase [Rhodospirillales bacterium]|nr:NAD(P)-dependent oxidoreductase [Rhodospirillales bacterium]
MPITSPDALNGQSLGFIGLGLMGKPMALNLKAAGANVLIHNRSRQVMDELSDQGMIPAETPAEVARGADILILMLSDTAAVETVLFGADGVIEGIHAGSLVVDMGTTEATATRDFATRIRAKGADYMDAPVSGGTIGAANGTLVFMAGGTDEAFRRIRPLLSVMGQNAVLVGDVGAGQVAKAANQIIVGLTISAVGEALKLAERAGVDPAKVREALSGGFAASRILEVHGQRMISGDFTPGGKCVTQRKDLYQALKLAREHGLELPTTALVMAQYDRAIEAGFGDLDHAALIKILDEIPSR